MSNSSIIGVSTGAAQAIGRYFSVVSVVPSSFYVILVYALITSGSWLHSPDWSQAFKSLEHLGVSGIAFLAFLSIALSVAIHPIQFAIVQFFEGYWGNSRLAQTVRSQRIMHYQRRCEALNDQVVRSTKLLSELKTSSGVAPSTKVKAFSRLGEANRVRESFPLALDHVMPTRLGNVLRRAEIQAGSQYGLNAIQVVPHLLLVAPPGHIDYVNDQRSQLDLAVRMTFISALSCATAFLFLWPYPLWVPVIVLPYALMYLSYRGSIVAAGHYGAALDTLISLDRFELYKQLHIQFPTGTEEERNTNRRLTNLLAYDPEEVISYHHSGTGRPK